MEQICFELEKIEVTYLGSVAKFSDKSILV